MVYNKESFSTGIATKQKKLQNPDDDTEIVQIGYVDTGLLTLNGEKIFATLTSPGSLPGASLKVSPSEGATAVAAAATAESLNQFPITAADHTAEEIGIARDWTGYITAGDSLTITGSTANDGTYVVDSVTYAAGTTTIVFVAGSLTDSTVDGDISFAADKFLIQSIVIQANAANTNKVYVGGAGIAAGLGISITAGEFAILEANGYPLDLSEIYIDVDTNGEGVTWTLLG